MTNPCGDFKNCYPLTHQTAILILTGLSTMPSSSTRFLAIASQKSTRCWSVKSRPALTIYKGIACVPFLNPCPQRTRVSGDLEKSGPSFASVDALCLVGAQLETLYAIWYMVEKRRA